MEVDFVLARASQIMAMEVKIGRRRTELPGIAAMAKEFRLARKPLVGGDGIPVGEFIETPPQAWF